MIGLHEAFRLAEGGMLAYFLVVNTAYAVLLVSAVMELRRRASPPGPEVEAAVPEMVSLQPRISLLAPAHNEERSIRAAVEGHLGLEYPDLEVVVVNDGSDDATLRTLREAFELEPIKMTYEPVLETRRVRALYRSRSHPNLVVVDKENGGKADALNAGLNVATGELVCSIDADTLVDPAALHEIARPFATEDGVVATGGTILVANAAEVRDGRVVRASAPSRMLAGIQTVEYLRAFLYGRLGLNRVGGNLIVSGAFGLFHRATVLKAGGYARDTVGEDMELILRLRAQGYENGGGHRVRFLPHPVAWTEVPERWGDLGRQRDRWHRGLADALWRFRRVHLNPRYRGMGLLAYPYFFWVELMAPFIEAAGLLTSVVGLLVGAFDWTFAALFFLAAYGYGFALTVVVVFLEAGHFGRYPGRLNRARLLGWAALENLGYRQATMVWRLRGFVGYLRGSKHWGRMRRRGFGRLRRRARPPSP